MKTARKGRKNDTGRRGTVYGWPHCVIGQRLAGSARLVLL